MRITREEIIGKIKTYFAENIDTFNDAVLELDGYNGILEDDRCYPMRELDELFSKPTDVLERAYHGWDDDSSYEDENGRKVYKEFNPYCEYFYFNAYGNLVSTSNPDYGVYLDTYAIEEMLEHRQYVGTIDEDEELARLFDELAEWDDKEDEEEE